MHQPEEIEYYFLITGHTYLPTDRDFGKIEKYQQKIENVYSPDHWRKVVLDCGRKNKFIVTAMGSADFTDLEDLKSNLNTTKDLCDDKSSKVHFSKAVCLTFESSAPLTMKIKHRMNIEFLSVTLKKKVDQVDRHLSMKFKDYDTQYIYLYDSYIL